MLKPIRNRSSFFRPHGTDDSVTMVKFGVLLIVFAYAFVLLVAVRPDVSWVHPEIQLIDNFVIHTNRPWYELIFNWSELEFAPRHTRPLSSLVQVIDSKIRLALPAEIYIYSQSWSVTWILSIFVNPFLFYRFLSLFIKKKSFCLFGAAIYLLSPTTLSSIVMFFRPAKVLAQFFLLMSILISASIAKSQNVAFKEFLKLGFIVFLGLISDEAGWFAIFAVFTYHLFFDKKNLKPVFLVLTGSAILALLIYLVVMPTISTMVWGDKQVLGDYFILKPILQSENIYLTLWALFLECGNAFLIHMQIFTRDIFALFPFNTHPTSVWKFVFVLSAVLLVLWVVACLMGLRNLPSKTICWLATCAVSGLILHSLLMTVVGNKLFGPYYYGAYITPFMIAVFIGISCDGFSDLSKKFSHVGTFFSLSLTFTVITLANTYLATNLAIKNIHFYPPGSTAYRQIFANTNNRFNINQVFTGQEKYIRDFIRSRGICTVLPVEMLWLATRLQAVNGAGFPPGDKTMKVCR